MDRQTLRDWVHRYNETGPDGVISRTAPGPQPRLNEAQMETLRDLVIAGPDAAIHGVVRWRCVDLRDEVARRFGVSVREGTIAGWLRKFGLTRLQPRPVHPKKDPAAEEAFKKPVFGRGPPVAVETGRVTLSVGDGAAEKFLVVATPSKNMAQGLLRA
jgi:transposase